MGASEWIAVAGICVAAAIAMGGGFVSWMISVVRNLSSIKENTGHLANRIDEFEDTCHDISSTLRSHGERILTLEERAGMRRNAMGS